MAKKGICNTFEEVFFGMSRKLPVFARGIIYENQISSRKQGTIFQQLTKSFGLVEQGFH